MKTKSKSSHYSSRGNRPPNSRQNWLMAVCAAVLAAIGVWLVFTSGRHTVPLPSIPSRIHTVTPPPKVISDAIEMQTVQMEETAKLLLSSLSRAGTIAVPASPDEQTSASLDHVSAPPPRRRLLPREHADDGTTESLLLWRRTQLFDVPELPMQTTSLDDKWEEIVWALNTTDTLAFKTTILKQTLSRDDLPLELRIRAGNRLAQIYHGSSDLGAAEIVLRSLLEQKSDEFSRGILSLNYALLQYDMGRADEAIRLLEIALRQNSDSSNDPRLEGVHFVGVGCLARLLALTDRRETLTRLVADAEKRAEALLKNSPREVWAQEYMAFTLVWRAADSITTNSTQDVGQLRHLLQECKDRVSLNRWTWRQHAYFDLLLRSLPLICGDSPNSPTI